MPENLLKEENKKGDKDREIILLGLLNLDSLYGENWFEEKEKIKKDIENKAVKLNQAFKYPSIFYEHFEFLSSDEYNYVKNNYIYSAILIYNPNISNKHNIEKKKNQGSKIKICHNGVIDSNQGKELTGTQHTNEKRNYEDRGYLKNEPVDHSKNESVDHSKNESVDHSKNEPVDHSKNESVDHSKNESEDHSKNEPVDHSKNESVDHSKNESVDHSKNESVDHSKNESVDHSKNEPVDHSKNEPVDHSKNEPVDHSKNEPVDHSKNNSKDCLNHDEKHHADGNHDKKKEGIGVLVITCKKMEKVKMKHLLIKMLKKEIKVESVVLKYKENIPHLPKSNNENKQKQTEIKYLDKEENISSPFMLNKNFDVKRNNFFNMTAYIYGSSNILANTSLVQREYCDDEWAEKLRKTKKEKQENNQSTDGFSNNILISIHNIT
ncbi:hypothetical protein PFLG_02350 [Plasmodium falciparum RAJ116]|uniref:Uncharacterized protein n=1 Tax=Plasmodium falciparum RAJ116 TaxID=580058 RepID=A0A0L0CY14_PLAFA|nr:hypothetical protein PFLG_02350 [Plasmodium falciparum RAJ116]